MKPATILIALGINASLLLLARTLPGCSSATTTEIKDTVLLRTRILNSIKNPFPSADTFIIDTDGNNCTLGGEFERPLNIATELDKDPLLKSLSANIHKPVISKRDFTKIVDTLVKYRYNGEYPDDLWHNSTRNKISANIHAEKLKESSKILVHETYLFNDSVKHFTKEFYTKAGEWQYKVTDSSAERLIKGVQ